MRKLYFALSLLLFISIGNLYSQGAVVPISNGGFEQLSITPWQSFGPGMKISTSVFHSGKQSLELISGTTAKTQVTLKGNSVYKISCWINTNDPSDQTELVMKGVTGQDVSAFSTGHTGWRLLEKTFSTGSGDRQRASVDIYNVANPNHSIAWADDVNLEYLGLSVADNPVGIHPLPIRVPKTELGITQQPNEKLQWLLDAKFGMFIHWGIYAGPAKGEWYRENAGMSEEEYRKFAYPESGDQYFIADKYDPDDWAKLAKAAGMKYMVLTAQHHDGYALFDSKYINIFSSKQTHNRDFIKEYTDACRRNGLRVGLYKTLINWRYPGYYDVTGTDCKPNKFGYTTNASHKENARLLKEELYCLTKELMTKYGKIDEIFWDGGWLGQQGSDHNAAYFWESGRYLDKDNAWPVNPYFQDIDSTSGKPLGIMGIVRKYQPDILVNERSGWYGDYQSEEGNAPITGPVRTKTIFEKCLGLVGWGYTKGAEDSTKVMSAERLERMLSDCVIRNMVLLANIGPDRHGQVPVTERKVLLKTGAWINKVNEAIYGTRGGPWNPEDGKYGFAYKKNTIYVYLLNDFKGDNFKLPAVNKGQQLVRAYNVETKEKIKGSQNKNREIELSNINLASPNGITIVAVELNKPVME